MVFLLELCHNLLKEFNKICSNQSIKDYLHIIFVEEDVNKVFVLFGVDVATHLLHIKRAYFFYLLIFF